MEVWISDIINNSSRTRLRSYDHVLFNLFFKFVKLIKSLKHVLGRKRKGGWRDKLGVEAWSCKGSSQVANVGTEWSSEEPMKISFTQVVWCFSVFSSLLIALFLSRVIGFSTVGCARFHYQTIGLSAGFDNGLVMGSRFSKATWIFFVTRVDTFVLTICFLNFVAFSGEVGLGWTIFTNGWWIACKESTITQEDTPFWSFICYCMEVKTKPNQKYCLFYFIMILIYFTF